MLTYLATLGLSFLLIGAVVIVLSRVRTPRYQLRRDNVITLLEMVLDGTASENDWNVFVALPIRHDEGLENTRIRCSRIERLESLRNPSSTERRHHLFSDNGLAEIEAILESLREGHDPGQEHSRQELNRYR